MSTARITRSIAIGSGRANAIAIAAAAATIRRRRSSVRVVTTSTGWTGGRWTLLLLRIHYLVYSFEDSSPTTNALYGNEMSSCQSIII